MTTSQKLRKQNIGWEFKIQIPTGPLLLMLCEDSLSYSSDYSWGYRQSYEYPKKQEAKTRPNIQIKPSLKFFLIFLEKISQHHTKAPIEQIVSNL